MSGDAPPVAAISTATAAAAFPYCNYLCRDWMPGEICHSRVLSDSDKFAVKELRVGQAVCLAQ